MQLTFDSSEPIENVLEVVSAIYGVQVTVAKKAEGQALGLGDDDQGLQMPRH